MTISELDTVQPSFNRSSASASLEISETKARPRILDIRREKSEFCSRSGILEALSSNVEGERVLPTLLLYNEHGLKLFEKITYLEEYYLTDAEIEVLESNCHRIAEHIQSGSRVVELGSGNLRKVRLLLDALDKAAKEVDYYALDVSLPELQRTLSHIDNDTYKHVKCFGLHGSYDDGLLWLQDTERKPTAILSLGASIGNFTRPDAATFLASFAAHLQNDDILVLGIDSCKDAKKIYHAYNDREGLTHQFILNGLSQANRVLGEDFFDLNDWKVVGKFNVDKGCHQAFLTPAKEILLLGSTILHGEKIRIEESYKYSVDEIESLWEAAGLTAGPSWYNEVGDYVSNVDVLQIAQAKLTLLTFEPGIHIVSKGAFHFSRQLDKYSKYAVPTLSDWENVWSAWDQVTCHMIPKAELMSKPIDLRNPCIFYLGHIPTFLDIHLTRATNGANTEPRYYTDIFERGIDPDVDDPTQCHAHSEIPQFWPTTNDILDYQCRVRNRLKSIYNEGNSQSNEIIAKSISMGFEHELMHLETLLYMLIQDDKMKPPLGYVLPDFEAAAKIADCRSVENKWFEVPETMVDLGRDESGSTNDCGLFGWDVEFPRRTAHTNKFLAKGRPITVGEYISYLTVTGSSQLPASWFRMCLSNNHVNGFNHGLAKEQPDSLSNGSQHDASEIDKFIQNKAVKTVWGAVPLKYALHWPVMASYDELSACAQWMGGRIPTQEEVRSIYNLVESRKIKNPQKALGKTIPAVNAHLVNDGVEESPPSGTSLQGSSSTVADSLPNALYANLEHADVGFSKWQPVAVTGKGDRLCGQGELGGVWEWTSSMLEKHEGFEAMKEYLGYTADFFDGKHNIILGGSWATHPRIAGRKSFVNWYQRSYPYAWAGARLVRDL